MEVKKLFLSSLTEMCNFREWIRKPIKKSSLYIKKLTHPKAETPEVRLVRTGVTVLPLRTLWRGEWGDSLKSENQVKSYVWQRFVVWWSTGIELMEACYPSDLLCLFKFNTVMPFFSFNELLVFHLLLWAHRLLKTSIHPSMNNLRILGLLGSKDHSYFQPR